MKVDDLKQGVESFWDKLGQGFDHLRQSAAGALTRFKPGQQTQLPAAADIDVPSALATPGWSLIGGDVFEDERRVVVRLELPGMERQDFDIEVLPRPADGARREALRTRKHRRPLARAAVRLRQLCSAVCRCRWR
jgi:hypothetical protein